MIDPALFYLLQITDSSFPIGAFSHSYGLETYTQQGLVNDEQSSRLFLENTLTYNTLFNDAAFVAWAFRYGEANDLHSLLLLDREVSALKAAVEIRTASKKLAIRFLKLIDVFVVDHPVLSAYADAIFNQKTDGNFALVFGLYCQQAGISLENTLTAFYYNTASGIVTNCAKLIPLSQMTGQKLLFNAQPLIAELVMITLGLDRGEIGRSTPEFDLKSMQHQNLYSRLYMS